MRTTYIYRLIDPFTNETRYIGATSNIFKRYREHTRQRNDVPSPKREWIRVLKVQGAMPFIHVLEVFEGEGYDHLAAEDQWMKRFAEQGAPLLNRPSEFGFNFPKAPPPAVTKRPIPTPTRRNLPRETSQFIGVKFDREKNKWRAMVSFDVGYRVVGFFRTEEAAAHAYDQAAVRFFGEFAPLNFPTDQQQSA